MNYVYWGPSTAGSIPHITTSGGLSSHNLNDSDNKVAFVFIGPKSGTVDAVTVYMASVTGSPPDYALKFVTLDSAGDPTTTAYSNAVEETFTPAAGRQTISLSTPVNVTAGDVFAVVIYPGATPPDGSNYISVTEESSYPLSGFGSQTYSTTWLNMDSGAIPVTLEYNDGSFFGWAINDVISSSIDVNTTPDELGVKFTLPFDCKCMGIHAQLAYTGLAGSIKVVLYDSGDTELGSMTLSDPDYVADEVASMHFLFPEVSLAKDTVYRAVISPQDTSNVYVGEIVFESQAYKEGSPIPQADLFLQTERTDGGSWTDTADQIVPLGLILSEITIPEGGGASGYIG